MAVVLDFVQDWRDAAWDALAAEGQAPQSNAEFEEVCYRYGDLQTRLIPARPRRVLVSGELQCPPQLQLGLEVLKDRIVRGEDLRPHSSRLVNRFDRPDDLLSDWGIYHLHLGTQQQADGLVERTGPVVFARFTEDTAYLIGIYEHGNWSRQDLVRTLHHNWPETISIYRIRGVTGGEIPLSDSEYGRLRRHQINAAVEVEPGVVYGHLGGGITASRTGVNVVRACDGILEHLRSCEGFVRRNLDTWVREAAKRGLTVDGDLRFRLLTSEDRWAVVEETTSIVLPLPGPEVSSE